MPRYDDKSHHSIILEIANGEGLKCIQCRELCNNPANPGAIACYECSIRDVRRMSIFENKDQLANRYNVVKKIKTVIGQADQGNQLSVKLTRETLKMMEDGQLDAVKYIGEVYCKNLACLKKGHNPELDNQLCTECYCPTIN